MPQFVEVSTSSDEKLASVKHLYALEAPVGEWSLMEREIIAGAQQLEGGEDDSP